MKRFIKALMNYPVVVFALLLKDFITGTVNFWNVVKPIWDKQQSVMKSLHQIFTESFTWSNTLDFLFRLLTILILYYVLVYIRKYKKKSKEIENKYNASMNDLKAQTIGYLKGDFSMMYFHLVTALEHSIKAKDYPTASSEIAELKKCLANMNKKMIEDLRDVRKIDLLPILDIFEKQDKKKAFSGNITELREIINRLPV